MNRAEAPLHGQKPRSDPPTSSQRDHPIPSGETGRRVRERRKKKGGTAVVGAQGETCVAPRGRGGGKKAKEKTGLARLKGCLVPGRRLEGELEGEAKKIPALLGPLLLVRAHGGSHHLSHDEPRPKSSRGKKKDLALFPTQDRHQGGKKKGRKEKASSAPGKRPFCGGEEEKEWEGRRENESEQSLKPVSSSATTTEGKNYLSEKKIAAAKEGLSGSL